MEALIPTPDDDERERLERATRGDAEALARVARDWRSRIRRWALFELGDPALAEDAAQEALVRLVRHIDRYDPSRPFAPWLRAIVRNCARTVGGRQRRHDHDALAEHHLRLVPAPEHRLDVGRTAERALSLFGTLSARQREVFHLCTQDGLSAAEAARELGIAPATARVLLFRARKTLRQALAEEAP